MPAPILSLADLSALLGERPGPLLGLDLGTKTIGLAITDHRRRLIRPLHVVRRTKFTPDARALVKLAAEREVAAFVIGLPLNMDGTEGPRAQSARSFARHFAGLHEVPIAFVDERLSTVEAEDRMRTEGLRAVDRRQRIDAEAAAVILEDALKVIRAAP